MVKFSVSERTFASFISLRSALGTIQASLVAGHDLTFKLFVLQPLFQKLGTAFNALLLKDGLSAGIFWKARPPFCYW